MASGYFFLFNVCVLIAWNLFKKWTFCHLGLSSFNLFLIPFLLFAWYFLFLLETCCNDHFLVSGVLKFQSFLMPLWLLFACYFCFCLKFVLKISFCHLGLSSFNLFWYHLLLFAWFCLVFLGFDTFLGLCWLFFCFS